MEQIKEAVYLINDERYLHLRENGAGVGFATYNKVTGEPLESGQISEKNLPPDGRNPQDKENFCGMTIKGMVYDDKKAAGERLLLARQEMPNADMMLLGTYRGFELNIR